MDTFSGKGSDDAVEQAEGRAQTGCYLLWLPVQFLKSLIFPMNFCEKENMQRADTLFIGSTTVRLSSFNKTPGRFESTAVHGLFVPSFCFQEMLRP